MNAYDSPVCIHCGFIEEMHANGKCLYVLAVYEAHRCSACDRVMTLYTLDPHIPWHVPIEAMHSRCASRRR
jgi:hypothetical protein